jgi:hypothetical protein
MPLLLLLIVGIGCLVMGGMWLGTIVEDIHEGNAIRFRQFAWAAGGIAYGIFCIISCIGHVSVVK